MCNEDAGQIRVPKKLFLPNSNPSQQETSRKFDYSVPERLKVGRERKIEDRLPAETRQMEESWSLGLFVG